MHTNLLTIRNIEEMIALRKKRYVMTLCESFLSCRTCGEMDDRSDDSVCKDGQREIVYAWAMDADSRALPEGNYKPLHNYIL